VPEGFSNREGCRCGEGGPNSSEVAASLGSRAEQEARVASEDLLPPPNRTKARREEAHSQHGRLGGGLAPHG
jgi:hypothetical protein